MTTTGAADTDAALRDALRVGAQALGVLLTDEQIGQLLAYLALLAKWGSVYNLTAVRGLHEMLTHHLLDSLAVVPPLLRHTGGAPLRLLDVGSGGGLPGAVIAVCRPEIDVTCIDAVAKKTAFVRQVAAALRLANLHAVHGRVESAAGGYDVVTSRAFASLGDFTRWSGAALGEGGVWLAMKGRRPQGEIDALPAAVDVFHVERLHVPGLEAERTLVWMRRACPALP